MKLLGELMLMRGKDCKNKILKMRKELINMMLKVIELEHQSVRVMMIV